MPPQSIPPWCIDCLELKAKENKQTVEKLQKEIYIGTGVFLSGPRKERTQPQGEGSDLNLQNKTC